jgi:hypothetical protein
MQERLASVRNPFTDGSERSDRHYLRKQKNNNPTLSTALLDNARSMSERLILLYYRTLARIISILRQVEAAVD